MTIRSRTRRTGAQTALLDSTRVQAAQELGGLAEQRDTLSRELRRGLDPQLAREERKEACIRAGAWIEQAHQTLDALNNLRKLAQMDAEDDTR